MLGPSSRGPAICFSKQMAPSATFTPAQDLSAQKKSPPKEQNPQKKKIKKSEKNNKKLHFTVDTFYLWVYIHFHRRIAMQRQK
ncbi:MAG: hypothetical protein UHP28_09150 [Treponema sp.]|nr:hypothetical protein [Treponema sp.]